MRYNRVFIIKPAYKGSYYGALHPPVGIGYIAEILRQTNIDYDVMDMSFKYSVNDLLKKMRCFAPDLVGITMMSFMYNKTHTLIRRLKQAFPNLRVVIGGAHASTYREEALEMEPQIDYAVTFEGERTLVELCKGIPFAEIKGLVYRADDGRLTYAGDRKFIKDLDAIPFPTYDKFELNRYVFNDIDIASSRGCPYKCIFCSVKAVAGRKLRVRSAENVVDEIEYWYKKGYRKFNFVDDNFTFYYDRVYAICDEIESRGLRDLRITNANGIRADRADAKLLARMKEVGFYYIGFGVECGNDKILRNIKKGETMTQIRTAIQNACDLDYEVLLNFLIGSPGETWQDIEDSVELAREFPVLDVRFNNITPTPKSELFDWLTRNNYFARQPEDYLNEVNSWSEEPVYFTPEMSVEDKRRALKYTRKVRKEVLKKAFVRKMSGLQLFAKIVAPIAVSDFMMNTIMYSRPLLRLAEKIRRK